MDNEEPLEDDEDDLLATNDDVAVSPGISADPQSLVEAKLPQKILDKFEVYSYRGAAALLSESHRQEFDELLGALDTFSITTRTIRLPGGNESDIPKQFSALLRPSGWFETIVQGDLVVRLRWKEVERIRGKKITYAAKEREFRRDNFLDGHKIDYVKNRVAFDLEWNSKDQTFDRDLYAFNAFAQCGVVDVGVLITRSAELNPVFRRLGPALDKNGKEARKPNGTIRTTMSKYGASTTWMGKLLYRLNAGRNGGCPVLAIGIRPACISDLDGIL